MTDRLIVGSESAPYKCLGLLGKLFGHKFYNSEYFTHNCQRCGMPKGGWK